MSGPESASPNQSIVDYTTFGHTAVITMNRPAARNAIDPAMAVAIEEAVDRAEKDDDVWTMILASAIDTFCAGADLKTIASGDFTGIETERGGFAGLTRRDRSKPLIAAVDGPALAGGCEIALCCDMIVASERATFGIPEVLRSLVAISGGLIRLPQVLPRGIAMELALTGQPIRARRAWELGMINYLTEPGEALDRALQLASDVNRAAPLAVRVSRQVLLQSLTAPADDLWALGWRLTTPLFTTDDFSEGPRAFIEKRDPRWQAR